MKKNVVLLAIGVLLVAVIIVLGTVPTLEIQTDPQTNSNITSWIGCPAFQAPLVSPQATGDIFLGGFSWENGPAYITSWHHDEQSDPILIDNDNVSVRLFCEESNYGYWGVDAKNYWWQVEIDANGDGNYDVTIMDENGIKDDNQGNPLAIVYEGYAGEHAWDLTNIPNGMKQILDLYDHNIACDDSSEWYRVRNPEPWHGTQGDAKPYRLYFRLYGPYDGIIRTTLWCKGFSWSDKCYGAGDDRCRGEYWAVYEEATLISAWGDIDTLPNPYPPFGDIFEEGQTLTLSLSTEWAGTIENGWILKFYDPGTGWVVGKPPGTVRDNTGTLTYDDYYNGYRFGNELSGHRVYWDIPVGTYNPSGNNEWRFKLYNAYTNVDSEFIWVIIQEGSELIPGPTTMTFDKDLLAYNVGDTMIITLEAEANPLGTGIIDRFEVRAWEKDGDPVYDEIFHLWDFSPINVYGDLYRGTIYAPITEVALYHIEGRAFDGDPDAGGMPGPYDSVDIGITTPDDPNRYMVVIRAIDDLTGSNVEGAVVYLGNQVPQRTGYDGTVDFPFMANGTYNIAVYKEGYMEWNGKVTINGANPPTVVARLKGIFQLLPLIICLLVVAIFGTLAYLLPIWDIRLKIVIFVIGLIIAVVIYLIMSGIIGFHLG